MKHLIIIGARGWGREVYQNAIHDFDPVLRGEMDVKGFLDDKADAFAGLRGAFPPILGPVETYEIQPDDVFICALGDAKWRKKYAEIILAKGGKFVSIVARGARVRDTALIGKGSVICTGASVSDNVSIGDFAIIHPQSILGHDVKVGDYCTIESQVFMGGYSQIGDMTTMHVKSSIIPHKRVGNRVSVGLGSVVMRNYLDDVHLFGNPAKKMVF